MFKTTKEALEKGQSRFSVVFIVNYEHMLHHFLHFGEVYISWVDEGWVKMKVQVIGLGLGYRI